MRTMTLARDPGTVRFLRFAVSTLCLLALLLYAGNVSAQIQVTTPKTTIAAGTPITIAWSGLPGNPQDWITLVPAGVSNQEWGEWFYTNGRVSGSHTFSAQKPGNYEVRVYLDWPDGGYNIVYVLPLAVESGGGSLSSTATGLSPAKEVYGVNEPIAVSWYGLPGNAQDWITLVPAGASNEEWGEWFYTNGMISGSHTFSGQAAGNYEVRAYYDWPDGGYAIVHRLTISVR